MGEKVEGDVMDHNSQVKTIGMINGKNGANDYAINVSLAHCTNTP